MTRAHRTGLVLAIALIVALLPATAATAENQPRFGDPEPPAPTAEGDLDFYETKIGPIELDPNGTGDWQDMFFGAIDAPDIDIPGVPYYAVRTATFDLVDAGGTPIPRDDVHLHHMLLIHPGVDDPACPGRPAHFTIASGMERTPIAIPDGYAWKIDDSQAWGSNWHFMNMSDQAQTVYATFTFGVDPDATDANTRWVEPWFLDIDGCGDAEFDVPGDGPRGDVYEKSLTWDVPDGGVVVGTGGHVHHGGIATELRDQDDRLMCRSEANYVPGDGGHMGHGTDAAAGTDVMAMGIHDGMRLDSQDGCPVHWALEPGKDLTVTGFYDNTVAQHGQMGIMVTFIWDGDQTDGLTGFPDVPGDHPFNTPILWGADAGITTGYAHGGFEPATAVSRQAILAFLYRLEGSPTGPWGPPPFTDVPPTALLAEEISWGAARGLVAPLPDGTLHPTWCVSRAELLVMAYGLAGAPAGPYPAPAFSDVSPANPYYTAVAWGADLGLTNGYEDGTFKPHRCLSRQAAMTILYRFAAQRLLDDMAGQYQDFKDHLAGHAT